LEGILEIHEPVAEHERFTPDGSWTLKEKAEGEEGRPRSRIRTSATSSATRTPNGRSSIPRSFGRPAVSMSEVLPDLDLELLTRSIAGRPTTPSREYRAAPALR
jgi:hypothetical protein